MNVIDLMGTQLAYVEEGHGDPIVLVHGMACDHTHMLPLLHHLAQRHRVVAVDLRGHGSSGKPGGAYDLDVFGDDLLELFDRLDLRRPVMIGHSLGGSISLRLAVRRPDAVRALVMLDSGIRAQGPKQAELGPFYAKLGGPDHAQHVGEWVLGRLFAPTDDPAMIDEITAMMSATPPSVFVAISKGVSAFDSLGAALECTVPSLLLMADRPFADISVLPQLAPNWSLGHAVGTGHFLQLVVPRQVEAMLDRYLELLPPTQS